MTDTPFWVRVTDKYPIADDCVALALAAEDGGALPPFGAGAYLDVDLGFGCPRQYSLAGDPADRHRYLLGVQKAAPSRGTSAALHDVVMPGHSLKVSPPKNLFPLQEQAGHSVLVGGGIGITPMLAFGHRLRTLGASFELHFCARSRARAPFAAQLDALPFADRIRLHLDDRPGDALDLSARLADVPADTHLYVCGPGGFMDAVLQQAATRLPGAQLHQERFDAAPVEAAPANAPFEVQIRSTGEVLQVGADQALVDVLQAHGLPVRRNCPRAFCGGCAVPVTEGEVDHRDRVLPDHLRHEAGLMLSCVSRAKGERLVLDL